MERKGAARRLTETAVLLALCIASQFLKNLSVYITGPIVNCIIIIAVLEVGLGSGVLISVIAPVTSFIITASPVMKAMPLIIPAVMLGNIAMALPLWAIFRKTGRSLPLALTAGTLVKGVFMGLVISVVIIPLMGPGTALPPAALSTARFTFSVTQLITAAIGSVIAFIIRLPLEKYRANREK